MRLCRECRHWQANQHSDSNGNYDRCLRPGAVWATVDLVRGEHTPAYAQQERNFTSKPGCCGPSGDFWEPSMDMLTTTELEASHV